MHTWVSHGLALVLVLALQPRAAAPDDRVADAAAGRSLLSEGDTLADKGETTEAVIRYKQAFEHLLPGMRKIAFKQEVKRDVTPREDMKGLLIKEIDEEMTPEEFRANELGMKVLGFIPRDMNLKETMVKVYAEEVAAFYDPKTKTMHLIREPAAKEQKQPSLLERLLGKKGGFDKDENKIVIAHELTHALADQNFDLEAMHAAAKGDDDRDLALSALIEGEATLTMFGAQMQDWSGTAISKLPASDLDFSFRLVMPFMALGGGPSLKQAPPILVETMIFPYLNGMVFCAHLTNNGGWDALNRAYREPPLSTEQVIHPEKYLDQPDPPTAIDLGELKPGSSWKEAGRNVVGEMQLSVMLRRHGGKQAAAGWDGDTFAVFEGPGDRLGLVWLSTWDTESDAREFAQSYLRYQTTKMGSGISDPSAFPDSVRRPHQGSVYAVERHDKDVGIVEGFPSEQTETLMNAAFCAKKTEKTSATPAKKKAESAAKADGTKD